MPSPKSSIAIEEHASPVREDENNRTSKDSGQYRLSRNRFFGSIFFNFLSFLLPALYNTLSKYWLSSIDSSAVVTVDAYTYIGVVAEVINEGLPRAAWLVIGNGASRSLSSRIGLTQTLIAFQSLVGFFVSLIIFGAARNFTGTFVPIDVRNTSLIYVRLSAFQTFSSALEYATSNATRALDHPEVPLIISISRFTVNITLDLLLVSPCHVGHFKPTVNTQGAVRLACDLIAAICGFVYFQLTVTKLRREEQVKVIFRPSFAAFIVLLKPGLMTLVESAVRNALYLWLVANIVSMGSDYATAWGVFNTIRWGLVMVPVQTLESSALTFVGHRWGEFRQRTDHATRPRAKPNQLRHIVIPALVSCLIAIGIEVPLCLLLSFLGAEPYALWLSGSNTIASITAHMWRTIDWCYIFYAMSTQLATILLSTIPRWYLYQSLASNLLFVFPWAIVCQVRHLNAGDAWTYHSVVFGGSLLFSFFDILLFVCAWTWKLSKGTLLLDRIETSA